MARLFLMLVLVVLPAVCPALGGQIPGDVQAYDSAGFHAGGTGLGASARAGREIWYKATAGNGRFHTYVLPQRLGVRIDWFRVLRSDRRGRRFATWGLINDPECCQPGDSGCPAGSLEQTFGLDWCHGDEALLAHVGRRGYRDPACDFIDAPVQAGDPHGPGDQRESSCRLAFGTSAGVLGLRKFPNPRFDAARWRDLNDGRLGTWEGFNRRSPGELDTKLMDASVEPPFLIGMACGACHIAFGPADPPEDPNAPRWQNINGLVGNQYVRMSEVLASGMPPGSLAWQVFSHARPGTVDTSAVPNDWVSNPGSVNAIINTAERPVFDDDRAMVWRKTSRCPEEVGAQSCWCEPKQSQKCWLRAGQDDAMHRMLKGGGDSTGALAAIQRVYINIGACAEQCWVNHLTDPWQLDPGRRNFGQTPFDIAQCRRDCGNFRAVEDRLENVLDFFLSAKGGPRDLVVARARQRRTQGDGTSYGFDDLVAELEGEFGRGSVARGRTVFARNCARCHSSQSLPDETSDFHALNPVTGLRDDWLGNDRPVAATEVGTHRCRALHSNHMRGRIWAQFASDGYRERPDVADIEEPSDGGRGYYRNVSLLNLWAHAPFMHNNAVGPELCGQGVRPGEQFYVSPYVNARGEPIPGPDCWPYDPSVEGRVSLYKASMDLLLNPENRLTKITRIAEPLVLDVPLNALHVRDAVWPAGLRIRLPAGTPVAYLGNLRFKRLIRDLVQALRDPEGLEQRFARNLGTAAAEIAVADMRSLARDLAANPQAVIDTLSNRAGVLRRYLSCTAEVENGGHRFGEGLSDADKRALTAFLATL